VFQFSLAWTEELARYIFLWLSALSIAYAFKTKSHFALTFLVDRVGAKQKDIIFIIVNLSILTFLSVFVWKAFEYNLSVIDQIGPSTGLSMFVPYSSAIVGGSLMIYYVLRDLNTFLNNRKN
jgi:C4-dicarboxylate transporter DctQ subunit